MTERERVRGGITVKLCKNIDSRSRRKLLCEAWWSGLPATVCPVQTAPRYYSQLYYNYAGGTRVLTLDFISVHAFTRWTVLFIDGRSCFHRAGSVVSREGLFQIAWSEYERTNAYRFFKPAATFLPYPIVESNKSCFINVSISEIFCFKD